MAYGARPFTMRENYQAAYLSVKKGFWNRMVVAHESNVERRAALKQNIKIHSMNRLDAFLARIMK